jgi:threonine dehydrogenase-like Zn-dependent dehydrogenase
LHAYIYYQEAEDMEEVTRVSVHRQVSSTIVKERASGICGCVSVHINSHINTASRDSNQRSDKAFMQEVGKGRHDGTGQVVSVGDFGIGRLNGRLILMIQIGAGLMVVYIICPPTKWFSQMI